jgi:signal transduction histidine kinase
MTIARRSRWYSSFYWRIGVSFVVLVIVVLVAQSVMFSFLVRRSSESVFRPPYTVATMIAADAGALLARDPAADVTPVLERHESMFPDAYVVLKNGRVFASTAKPLPEDVRRDVEAVLTGAAPPQAKFGSQTTGPVVSAPIQVANELRGMVVMPPPPKPSMLQEIGRLLSLPGTVVLVMATGVAALIIFAPARRRLLALERAAEQFGRGELAVRAPEGGSDEIARVARAFNRMAGELAARDEALQASDRLRRQMFADVSHELKTPLTAMLGYLDTLQMQEMQIDPATRRRYLDTVGQETRRLERIVRDLLDLARYENGVGELNVRVFAIERVFNAVIGRHEGEAKERGITIGVHMDPSADQVIADPDRIEQVIENLAANALRHTPAGGTIELHAAPLGEGWGLAVIDSGHGIAREHLPHVFDRFYKVDYSRTTGAGGGSGLGLSIAKAIVERHGGTIAVTSRPGRTEFSIVLPGPSDQTRPADVYSTSANL